MRASAKALQTQSSVALMDEIVKPSPERGGRKEFGPVRELKSPARLGSCVQPDL